MTTCGQESAVCGGGGGVVAGQEEYVALPDYVASARSHCSTSRGGSSFTLVVSFGILPLPQTLLLTTRAGPASSCACAAAGAQAGPRTRPGGGAPAAAGGAASQKPVLFTPLHLLLFRRNLVELFAP